MRRSLAILALCLAAALFLAACTPAATTPSGDPAATNAPAGSPPPAGGDGEVVHISVMLADFVNVPMSMDQLAFKTLGERLGLYLDLDMITGVYNDTLNLRITSNDLPDLYTAGVAVMGRYYSRGIVLTLDELLAEKAPNVLAAIEEAGIMKNVRYDDGHIYYIPKIEESARMECSGWINHDWMEQCGLTEAPATTDELYTALKTFQEQMPADTYPMTKGQWYTLEAQFYRAFGTAAGWILLDPADGYVFAPYFYKEGMREALTYMNKLYAEGLIDPEYVSRDDDSVGALITDNKVGYMHTWTDGGGSYAEGGIMGVDFIGCPPLQGNDDYYSGSLNLVGGQYSINAGVAEPQKEKIFEMLNYMYGPEGEELFCWGVEGETYNVIDGEKVFIDEIMNHEKGALNGRRMYGMQPNPFLHISSWEGWEAILPPICGEVVAMHEPVAMPQQPIMAGTEEEETELAGIMGDVTKYTTDSLVQFVTGALPMSEFDAFIAQLEQMNIARAQEIQQAMYTRWNAR